MPSASLAELPPELLLLVYKSLDSIQDITKFNRTSRKFYALWYENTTLISNAVLPHVIESFDDAQELFEIQQRPTDQQDVAPYQKQLDRNKKLLSTAREVNHYCTDHFLPKLKDRLLGGRNAVYTAPLLSVVSAPQWHRDPRTYYRIWILVVALDQSSSADPRFCLKSLYLEILRAMHHPVHREERVCNEMRAAGLSLGTNTFGRSDDISGKGKELKPGQMPLYLTLIEARRILEHRIVAMTEDEGMKKVWITASKAHG